MTRLRPSAVALAAVAVLAVACRGETSSGTPAEVRRYTVRGEVVRLPAGSERELRLRHEPIPDFVDRSGQAVGMGAMVMPFPVEPSVSLDGIAVGDKVRVRFSVDWSSNRFAIESMEELPADTVLDFGTAKK